MRKTGIAATLFFSAMVSVLFSACSSESEISYAQDVRPVLEANCLSCHQPGGAGYESSGFSMVSYDDLMKGTEAGPMIVMNPDGKTGDVEGSNLLVLMEGRADPSISMPHGSLDPVPGGDIELIRKWIAQGAKNN